MDTLNISFIIFFLILNLLSFFIVILDKKFAEKNLRRIPENYFFVTAILGGWPMGSLTMKTIRHKTVKRSFQVKYFLSSLLNILIIGIFIFIISN